MNDNRPFKIEALDKQKDKSNPLFIAKIPFTIYICASKGGGKSTTLIQLLRGPLRAKFNRIVWVSPTAKLDDKVQSLKNEKSLLSKNTKLIKLLNKIKKDRKIMGDYNADIDYPTEMTDSDYKEKIDINFLNELIEEQKNIITEFGKEFADNILIVLDDSVMDKLLKLPQFADIIFKSRHFKLSFVIISQSYKSLPKKLRLNNSQILLFETGNAKEINDIYQENQNGVSFDEFYKYYKQCINEPFGFLNINYDNFKGFRFIKNFEKFLQIE